MTTLTSDTSAVGHYEKHFWLAMVAIWQREMVRFVRQPNRVVGALLTPVVFWLLLGSGLNDVFIDSGGSQMGYQAYFFPGTVLMILLFTAIFSTVSVIEDRRDGFLQAVLASPAPRLSIALGKILGGATLATGQGAAFLLAWPMVADGFSLGAFGLALGVMFVLALGLTGLGLCLAWPMDSTAGFHALMNLVLMPMWFLSGAIFPVETAPQWMRLVMYLNPLTYGLSGLRQVMYHSEANVTQVTAIPMFWAISVTVLFTCIMFYVPTKMISKPRRAGV